MSSSKALVTLMDDNFMPGFRVFWKSFIAHNSWFNYDFVIFDCGLSKENKQKLRDTYEKIIIKPIQRENYEKINFSRTAKKLRNTYYTFEIFTLDYDRVVFMDMDILVLGDYSEVFNSDVDIAGCKGYGAKKDKLSRGINTGMFTVSKKYLNDETYRGIIKHTIPGFSMPDQHAINGYFSDTMKYFNKKYNVEKRMLHTKRYAKLKHPRFIVGLHFVAWKPWQDKTLAPNKENQYAPYEALWHAWSKK